MTRHPYGHDELDRPDPLLDEVAHRLEAHARERGDAPAPDLLARIHAAIDAEPDPKPGWWRSLLAGPGEWAPAARRLAAAGVAAVVLVATIALGSLVDGLRNVGASPTPAGSPTQVPTASPTTSPTAVPTSSVVPAPSPTPIAPPGSEPSTPRPGPSDEDPDDSETPEPSESDDPDDDQDGPDESETPEPSESDDPDDGDGGS